MKSAILITFIILSTFSIQNTFAQRDNIYKKDSTQIRCKILKETYDMYHFAFLDSSQKISKKKIEKSNVDSVSINFYESNLIENKIFNKVKKSETSVLESAEKKRNWRFTTNIGANIGNFLEFNNASGTDKKSLSGDIALDLGFNYAKENSRFNMSNELHWMLSLQKDGLTGSSHIQRASDAFSTLHDISYATRKSSRWNFNLIAKTSTSIFNIYNGDYFRDVNHLGKIQGFLSPYEVTISPGIKWEANKFLRLSLSPYSFNLYGVKNQQVSNTGTFISDLDAGGNYKKFLFKRLGADLNIWYDRRVKEWLYMQYRLSLSSNYFEKIFKNGQMDGIFITKIKLLKDLYLTHRATIKSNFSSSTFKPYYSQAILLSYSKSF